jgi:hypothetical protein
MYKVIAFDESVKWPGDNSDNRTQLMAVLLSNGGRS